MNSSTASLVSAVVADMMEVATQGAQLLESDTAVSLLQAGGLGDLTMLEDSFGLFSETKT